MTTAMARMLARDIRWRILREPGGPYCCWSFSLRGGAGMVGIRVAGSARSGRLPRAAQPAKIDEWVLQCSPTSQVRIIAAHLCLIVDHHPRASR